MNPQSQVLETGHFSECAEYALDAYQAASQTRVGEHNQRHFMTNNTFNFGGGIQGGAVSLGGDAHNNGNAEFRGYPEPIRQKIQSELDGLERAIQAISLDDRERQETLAKIADVKAEPSAGKIKSFVEGLKAVGDIGTAAAPFLTAIGRLASWS